MTDTAVPAVDARDLPSLLFTSPNRLKMAAFHMNCTRGGSPTLAEGSIASLDWQQQVRIAQLAERAGLEGIIPIARWRGYPGPSRFNVEQYEVMPWAAGIAAATSTITVFATAHVPLIHPIRAAKEAATIDHIADGRFCLNVVAGWNAEELAMFGVTQREHDARYTVAAEWTTFVKRLWMTTEPFDFEGSWYTSSDVVSEPKPIQRPRPPIMSAGSSPAGRDFAAAHADICFAAAEDIDGLRTLAADIKSRAAGYGREVGVWATTSIVCGDTEADAQREYDYFVHEHGDWQAVEAQVQMLMGGNAQTIDFDTSRHMQERLLACQYSYPLMGTPEQVVSKMGELADAGIDGITIIWWDYERGLAQLHEQLLPLARRAGLRSG